MYNEVGRSDFEQCFNMTLDLFARYVTTPFTKLISPKVRVFDLLCRSALPCVRSQPKRNTFRAGETYKNPKTRPTKVR